MPPKSTSVLDELIKALQDDNVKLAIASIFETKLTEILDTVKVLKSENDSLRNELNSACQKIESLEAYSKRSNLIFTGIETTSFADAVTQQTDATTEQSDYESTSSVENAVVELVNVQMKVQISKQDISVAHRLRKRPNDKVAPVIVRFTSLKVRDAVCRARRSLKGFNEDLTKNVAGLFRQARERVKNGLLAGAWTAGGVLFVRKSDDLNSRPIKITSLAELDN
jgi:hypothetical protein